MARGKRSCQREALPTDRGARRRGGLCHRADPRGAPRPGHLAPSLASGRKASAGDRREDGGPGGIPARACTPQAASCPVPLSRHAARSVAPQQDVSGPIRGGRRWGARQHTARARRGPASLPFPRRRSPWAGCPWADQVRAGRQAGRQQRCAACHSLACSDSRPARTRRCPSHGRMRARLRGAARACVPDASSVVRTVQPTDGLAAGRHHPSWNWWLRSLPTARGRIAAAWPRGATIL